MTIKSYFRKIFLFIITSVVMGILLFPFIFYKISLPYLENFFSKTIYPKYTKILIEQHHSIENLIQFNEVLLFTKLRNELKREAELGYKIAYAFFEQNINNPDKEDAKRKIIKILSNIRFRNGKGYFFIFDLNGISVLDPLSPGNEGKNLINSKDKHGDFYIKKIIRMLIIKREGFYEYTVKNKREISFFKLFEPYRWGIGCSGSYESVLNNFKKNILKKLNLFHFAEDTGVIVVENSKIIFNKSFQGLDISKFKTGFNKNANYISYVTLLPELNWKIVSVFNKQPITTDLNGFKSKISFVSIIFVIPLILVSLLILAFLYFIFGKFENEFIGELEKFKGYFRSIPNLFVEIDINKFKFDEFKTFGKYTNNTIKVLRDSFKKSEEKNNYLQLITENLGIGIAIIDKKRQIEFCNNDFQALVNFDFEKKGQTEFNKIFRLKGCDLGCEESRNKCAVLKVLETGESYESDSETIVLNNGKEIPVFMLVNPIRGKEKFVLVIKDIIKERKIRNELVKVKRAVEQAPVSIVITDINGTIEYVNPFFSKITGYSEIEAIGNKPKVLKTKHNEKYHGELWNTIMSGKVWEGEFLNKKKTGETYWEKAVIGPVFDNNGSIMNFVAVKQDISLVKDLQNSLKRAKAEAEVANKMKSEFLASMSHEIRTPMNALIGFIDLFYDTEVSETQKQYLDIIKSSTENLMRILNDILDLSKLEAGKMDFEEVEFGIKELISNVFNIFSKKAGEKGISLKVEVSDDMPQTLKGDPTRITQVINNLVSNAIKFTDKGEVGINVKLNNLEDNIAEVLFLVYDTGVGIRKDKIDKIFESFTQEDASVTRKFGGTGLGLAIVSKIIKAYEGKIWVESEPGKGSKFYFILKLPVVETEIKEVKKKKQVEFAAFKGASVLVAEDNLTNQILIKEIFKKFSVEIDLASNGIEALEKIAEKDYELIFFDWHMPEMDGVEAVKILRKVEKGEVAEDERISKDIIAKLFNRKFKVIALTAAVLENEKSMLKEVGFDEFLSKPIDYQKLTEVLKKNLVQTEREKEKEKQDIEELKKFIDFDEELLTTLLDSFKNSFKKSVEELREGIDSKDFEKIKFAAHSIKGSAYNIRLNKIGELAEKMEKLAKESKIDNLTEIEKLLEKIKNLEIE